jgi:hypothetical protein
VESFKGAGEAVEEGRAGQGVGAGVDRGEEEVAEETPVGEDGEIGEFIADVLTPIGVVGACVTDDVEAGDEGIKRLFSRMLALFS